MRHLAALTLLLAACDPDGDLLSHAQERALGTSPRLGDSDGDGLSDGVEDLVFLTDPTKADSDGDGDDDGWEVSVDLDPLDPASHRYLGGWPHLDAATKAALQVGSPGLATVGRPVRRLHLRDPHGDLVDLYDFARSGAPAVLMVTDDVALAQTFDWLTGSGDSPAFTEIPQGRAVREALHRGRLRLILIASLGTGEHHEATDDDVRGIALSGSNRDIHHVPVLRDQGFAVWGHLDRPSLDADDPDLPTHASVLLDEDFVVRAVDDWDAVLDTLDL
jgi:hypothetical protein